MNYELCCSRSKQNVLLKFLGKKMGGAAKKWVVSSVNDLLRKIVRCKSSSDTLIKGRKHFSESVMASVAVFKAGKTSVNFIDNTIKEPRQMQVTTAKLCYSDVFSRRFVRSIRRSFRVSTGRHAVSSSEDCEVNCQVPAVYRAEFRRTVCMATQQPGLKSV